MKKSKGLLIESDGEIVEVQESLPLIPLRDMVIFPHMVVPFLVGRPSSVVALESAVAGDQLVFLVVQKNPETAEPGKGDMHRVGAVARIVQTISLPEGSVKVLVEGLARARVKSFLRKRGFFSVRIELVTREVDLNLETVALLRSVRDSFEDYVKLNRKIPNELLLSTGNLEESSKLADVISANLMVNQETKQKLLETVSMREHLELLLQVMTSEIQILRLERKIEGKIKTQVSENQKQFYLTEQLRAIKKELGYEEGPEETAELRRAIDRAGMPKEVKEKALKELTRLEKMPPLSPEATVVRNYLDWLCSMPWKTSTKDNLDIARVEKILNEDHYGLEKVKERLIEYLSVLKLVKSMKGPILCFVGAPGVGKTSLGKSIARALGRKFVRVSLGGIRDEAEIRGHRRTYIGALPGRIIQQIKRAGTKNPVFLLDEIDKVGADFRGDPAAGLLEALDPEVNQHFNDHYLEVDFDLSRVLFITTCNVLHTIPPALVDRMEVIRLPGYLEHEKLEIAKGFLIPKELKAHGLSLKQVKFTEGGILEVVRHYTQEAGVRNLEREIASILRKVARRIAFGDSKGFAVTRRTVESYLGPPRFLDEQIEVGEEIGVATGLAWTEFGGDILSIEVGVLPGRGRLILTGHLGEVMKESAQAALSYARSRAPLLGIEEKFYRRSDIHVHIPEGAIPKDGPSAGVAIATALVSALTRTPVKRKVAMTGEITLRGIVLPVGGLAEKFVAAQRAGVSEVIVPKRNEKDVKELHPRAKKGMRVRMVKTQDEVLRYALKSSPKLAKGISPQYKGRQAAYTH